MNEVRTHPMRSIVDRILTINAEESARYVAADSARRRHWAMHPTGFAALKCMDGRVHLPAMTGIPLGIVKPFRAIGGRFEVWWPAFAKRIWNWTCAVRDRGHRCAVFVTYHHSASDAHLGCAGWKYQTEAARAHAERLAADLADVFGEQMTPIVTGIETDRGVLVLHGFGGRTVSGDQLVGASVDEVRVALTGAFPAMDERTLEDCIPFLNGNAAHLERANGTTRPTTALRHNERVIAIGHGFDYWIAQANTAVIVNDVDPNLDVPIATAAQIIEGNLVEAASGDDALLLASVPFGEYGTERDLAIHRARGLLRFAQQVIRERNPKLADSGRLHALIGITFEQNKLLEVVE